MVNSKPPIEENEPTSRQPVFNAPLSIVILSALLIALHALFSALPIVQKESILMDYALFPERFWAASDLPYAYDNIVAKYLPFIGHGLLHADWGHVLVNAFFALAFGAGALRVYGSLQTFIIYITAQFGGAYFFLVYSKLMNADLGIAIGASGAVSGLTAAVFLMMAEGAVFSRSFITLSMMFVLGNIVFAVIGPSLLGASIAWEAHIGGYGIGALLAYFFSPRIAKS